MSEHTVLERELLGFAMALVFLAISGSVARLIRLPILLGYLVAGVLAQTLLRPFPSLILLSSVGVMLLLFFLGMEFDWRRLFASPHRLVTTAFDLALNFALPFILLSVLGLPYTVAFVIAMAIYPTSSAITLNALLQLRRLANPETETIVWVLVGEDLIIVILLAIASGLTGEAIGVGNVITAFIFIVVMLIASVVLTRPLEWFFEHMPSELDSLVSLSIIVFLSATAYMFHLSEALGAFLAGMLFSGTRDREELEQKLHVLREVGTAVFFFTFGLQAPMKVSAMGMLFGLAMLVFGIATKTLTAYASGLIEGLRRRARLRLLFSIWIRGEFSIIALFMGREVLSSVWQEAVSWFIIASIVVGMISLSVVGKLVERM